MKILRPFFDISGVGLFDRECKNLNFQGTLDGVVKTSLSCVACSVDSLHAVYRVKVHNGTLLLAIYACPVYRFFSCHYFRSIVH